MSLNRGFTFAGARSLVSSLWRVNERATAQIFTSFYEELKNGSTKSEALHTAKSAYLSDVAILDEEKSPYYWAGFIQYGDDRALNVKAAPHRSWLIWLGVLVLLALLLWLVRLRFYPAGEAVPR